MWFLTRLLQGHTLKALAAPAHVKQFILQLRRLKSRVLGKLMLFKNRNEIDELELVLGKILRGN